MTGKPYGTIEKIIAAAVAFLAVAGFNLLYGIRGESTMFSNSVFCMVAFGAFLFLGLYVLGQNLHKRIFVYGFIGGFLGVPPARGQ